MSITFDGETYYRTAEVCQMAGISKNTLLRWIRDGVFPDAKHRDRRGWRIFTKSEGTKLKAAANKVYKCR